MRRPLLAAALGATLAAGCGTVASLTSPDDSGRVYGGIRRDIDWAVKIVDGPADPNGPLKSGDGGAGMAALAAFLVVAPVLDFPLSLAADTLAFPLVRWLDRDK
jgi:uncharacterized protein YceK